MTLLLSQLVSAWPVLALLGVTFSVTGVMAALPLPDEGEGD